MRRWRIVSTILAIHPTALSVLDAISICSKTVLLFQFVFLNSTISLGGHDIEESWQIDSQKLRVFDDEVLGEGEFGIVKKGHYGEKNVAVKQLKGGKR